MSASNPATSAASAASQHSSPAALEMVPNASVAAAGELHTRGCIHGHQHTHISAQQLIKIWTASSRTQKLLQVDHSHRLSRLASYRARLLTRATLYAGADPMDLSTECRCLIKVERSATLPAVPAAKTLLCDLALLATAAATLLACCFIVR